MIEDRRQKTEDVVGGLHLNNDWLCFLVLAYLMVNNDAILFSGIHFINEVGLFVDSCCGDMMP